MPKKIRIDDLCVGMVIEKMDRPWTEHPFLTNRKKITSEDQIRALRAYGIEEVYIDAEDGADTNGPDPRDEWSDLEVPLEKEVPLDEELRYAEATHREAQHLVRDVMQDVRLGRNIESEKVSRVVGGMIDSIFRNADALSSLTRLKGYDDYTFVHSVNVGVLSLALGRSFAMSRRELEALGIGALLHDTGKIRVPAGILNKPGRLDDAEMEEIRRHPLYSVEVLEGAGGIPDESKRVALQHHERWNGNGYPHGITGEEIGPFGQIAAICDVYDAMTSDRVYAKGMPPHEGIRKIHGWAGMHFSEELVHRFIRCMGIYPVGTVVQLDTREVGVVTSLNREKVLRPRLTLLFRDLRTRLPEPVSVDLEEKAPGGRRFARTIVGPLDPSGLGIDPSEGFVEDLAATAG
ncbi:MAG: HD-GYP domain-containing protein [Deltaproteobacteria bacterium]